jgi:hypothetical protein
MGDGETVRTTELRLFFILTAQLHACSDHVVALFKEKLP